MDDNLLQMIVEDLRSSEHRVAEHRRALQDALLEAKIMEEDIIDTLIKGKNHKFIKLDRQRLAREAKRRNIR